MKLQPIFFASTLAFSIYANAFFSLMDTGELLNKGYHRVTADSQVILSDPNDGFNLNGKFSTGLNQDSDIQGEFGVGTVDFFVAGYWKWVPYPDTSTQPAVGARFGFTYADINSVSTYGLQATPLISKHFEFDNLGMITPYAGLPLGLQKNNNDTFVTMQFIFGTQYTHPSLRHVHFLLEYGLEIDDAFNHISLGAAFDL